MASGAAGDDQLEPYDLDPAFEVELIRLTCADPQFFAQIGRHLEVGGFLNKPAQLAVRAAQAVASDNGDKGPSSPVLVLQRLKRWSGDGDLTYDDCVAVYDLLEKAEDAHAVKPVDRDSIVAEVLPLVQRRVQDRAIQDSMSAFQQKTPGSLDAVIERLQSVRDIGKAETDDGLGDSVDHLRYEELVAEHARLAYIPTGIRELDEMLDGGLPRGQEGVALGSTGSGKSMFLTGVTAAGLNAGYACLYATLELSSLAANRRILSARSSVRTKDLDTLEGLRRMVASDLRSHPHARCFVKRFTPKFATPQDIEQWVELYRKKWGRIDLLCVDYADKLTYPGHEEDRSEYAAMGKVYEYLRLMSERGDYAIWTASQAKVQKKGSGPLDIDDMADSANKGRVADLVIGLAVTDGMGGADRMVSVRVIKNRHGESRGTVRDLPAGFAYGCFAMSESLADDVTDRYGDFV